MKRSALILPAAFLATTFAHAQTTGVSNPPDAVIEDTPAKPSAAIPLGRDPNALPPTAVTQRPVEVAPRPVPMPRAATVDEDSMIVTEASVQSPALRSHFEDDSHIVTEVPASPNELPPGTVLRLRLPQDLATNETVVGTQMECELMADVERNGRVYLPAGSIVRATVTAVRGGKRIHGAAMMHFELRSIVMPDGTIYPLHASLVDTDRYHTARIDNEGNLVRRDHVGKTLAAMSLTTGASAAAGAVIGGGPGALIGAGIGAGVSTIWWLKQDRQMHLGKDTMLVFQLTQPIQLASAGRIQGE